MKPTVILISNDEADSVLTELASSLRHRLPTWTVHVRNAAQGGLSQGMPNAEALLVVITTRNDGQCLTQESCAIISEYRRETDGSIVPILLDGAKMPKPEQLPNDVGWFNRLNAFSLSSDQVFVRTKSLANVVCNSATLIEAGAPSSFLRSALALSFWPLVVSPMWAIGTTFVAVFATILVKPSAAQVENWTATDTGVMAAICWVLGVVICGFVGRRRFSIWSWEAAALGTFMPWSLVLFAAILCLTPSLVSGVGKIEISSEFTSFLVFGLPAALLTGILVASWSLRSPRLKLSPVVLSIISATTVFAVAGYLGRHSLVAPNTTTPLAGLVLVLYFLTLVGFPVACLKGIAEAADWQNSRVKFRPKTPPAGNELQGRQVTSLEDRSFSQPRHLSRKHDVETKEPRVFLSYRRLDSAHPTKNIYEALTHHIDRDHVFRDVDAIPFGLDFKSVIECEIERSDVFVAVVGPEWVGMKDKSGKRLLDRSIDFVRLEIELAISRHIPVVVVLVGGASKPLSSELPKSIALLASSPAVSMMHEADFGTLIDRIRSMPAPPPRALLSSERNLAVCDSAIRHALVWATGGCLIGLSFVLSSILGGDPSTVLACVLSTALVVLPMGFGCGIGLKVAGTLGGILGALLMPSITLIIFLLGYVSGYVPRGLIARSWNVTPSPPTLHDAFLMLTCYLMTVSAIVVALRYVLKHRARRIRVFNPSSKIVGAAVSAFLISVLGSYVLTTRFPLQRSQTIFFYLVLTLLLAATAGSLGLLQGAVKGALVRDR